MEIGDQLPNTEQTLVPGHHSPTCSVFRVLLFLVNSSWKVSKQVCVCRPGTKGKAFPGGSTANA